ncbi:hypothetical protein Hanom_Chr09g00792131 [Helianthus anomalus]
MEELKLLDGKFKTGGMSGARSYGSVSSKEQQSGATPTSAPGAEETEADLMSELTRKNTLKHQREESRPTPMPTTNKVAFCKPLIGKKANLVSLIQISPGMRFIMSYYAT